MKIKTTEKSEDSSETGELRRLILYNSNHVWDDVIAQISKATGYDHVHCEQIAMIAHTKGKAVVKSGGIEELEFIDHTLKEIDLVTSIE
ncbi:MAG: ATP-dependent Clp protease adaptor ClpS [bacterium]